MRRVTQVSEDIEMNGGVGLDACEPAVEPTSQPMSTGPAGLPTHLPMWKMVLALAMWPMLEQLLGALIGTVDTILAGRMVPAAMEAIGTSGYMLWLMGLLQGAVGVGSTAIIARHVARAEYSKADDALGQSMYLAFVWGLANAVLFWVTAPYLGLITSLEGDALAFCTLYLRYLALVAPCRAVIFIGAACLRGAGDTRSPFFVMLLVNVVNTLVSVVLVLGFGVGFRGIAIGTMVAWVVGSVVMWGLLQRGRGGIRLHLPNLKPQREMLGRLLRVGVPSLIENVGHWGGNLLVVVMVGYLAKLGLNESPMGSQIVGIRIEAFSFLLGFGFNIAAATIVGQYLGVGDVQSAKRATWVATGYTVAIMVSLGVLMMTIPATLTWVFTDQEPFLTDVPPLIFHAGWAQLGFAFFLVLSGALRGAGDTKTTMWMTYGSTFGVRLPLTWLVGIHLGYGLEGIWVVLSGELTLRGGLFLWRFLHGGWARVRV